MDNPESINAGLNDDDLIDLENNTPHLQNDPIRSTIAVPELPPIDEETKVIAEAKLAIEGLLYVIEDLQKVGGMSQSIATEAAKFMEDFDGSRPLGYYSLAPSATRMKPAMESMSNGVLAAIAVAIVAAAALIYKILRWMLGLKNTSAGNSNGLVKDIQKKADEDMKNVDEMQKGLDKIIGSTEKASSSVSDGVEVKSASGFVYKPDNLNQLATMVLDDQPDRKDSQDFLECRNPFFYDVVTNGIYVTMVKEYVHAVQTIDQLLQVKVQAIRKIIESAHTNTSVAIALQNKADLAKLVDPLTLETKGGKRRISEIAADMQNTRLKVQDANVTAPMQFVQVFPVVMNMYDQGPLREIIENSAAIGSTLGDMEELLKDLKGAAAMVGNKADITPEQVANSANNLRLAIEVVQIDVMDLAVLLRQFEHYRLVVVNLGERAVRFAEQTAIKLAKAVEGGASPSVLKDLHALAKSAHDTRARQMEHFKRIFPDAF